jgi:hypothetical protein
MRGQSTNAADFGAPTLTDDYALCMYDESAVAPALVFRAAVPAGGVCRGRQCWKAIGSQSAIHAYRYDDPAALQNGITRMQLEPGTDGRATVVVRGKGTSLPLPSMPLDLPLRVQLQAENGACWEARYGTDGLSRNDAHQFRGTAAGP